MLELVELLEELTLWLLKDWLLKDLELELERIAVELLELELKSCSLCIAIKNPPKLSVLSPPFAIVAVAFPVAVLGALVPQAIAKLIPLLHALSYFSLNTGEDTAQE